MFRKDLKIAVILAAVLLFIGLALVVSPQDAFAADYNHPDPEDIIMDIDNSLGSFSSKYLYYNSSNQSYHNGSDAFDAYYKPDEGILYLWNYSGTSIHVVNSEGKQLTIYLISENTITTQGYYGIMADGVKLDITSDVFGGSGFDPYDMGTLNIKLNMASVDADGAGIINYISSSYKEDITIRETARVFIDAVFPRAGSGVRAGAKLILADESVLDVNVRFGTSNASSGYHGQAVYAGTGMQISNTSFCNLSAASRDGFIGNYSAYSLYLDDGDLVLNEGAEYLALSCVGKDRALCNKTLPETSYENDGYYYSKYDTHAASAVFYRGDYEADEVIPVNAYFFPDPSFRKMIRVKFAESDDWVYVGNLQNASYLYVDTDYYDTVTLKGIELFGDLQTLDWEHGNLSEADLSYNTVLQYLYLYDNRLELLNICNCGELVYLDLDNNLLTMLDVRDNTKLQTVYCGSVQSYDAKNRIPTLDFSACTDLQYLYTRGNEGLKSLKLGDQKNLQVLSCFGYEDSLELIDISGCPLLVDAYRFGAKDSQAQYYTSYTYNEAELRISGAAVIKTDSAAPTAYPEITTCRLELAGKIGIRIYFRAPDNAERAGIFYESDGYKKEVVSISLSRTNNPYYSPTQDLFVMIFPKITSREMTMRIKFVIYDDNGNPMNIYYSEEGKLYDSEFYYCAADWANRILKTAPGAEAVTMAKSLLNYGDCAQKYLSNYNSAHPADPRHLLRSEMSSFEHDTAYDKQIPYYAYDEGFDYTRLALEADTVIRIYLNKDVKVNVDGVSKKVYNSGNVWLAMIEGITSRNMSKMYNIEIVNGSTTVPMSYSVLSWANDMIERGIVQAIPTAKALYFYNSAAKAYIK